MLDQTGQFNAQYLDTLELYKVEFGVNPPANIWDKPKFNFENVDENKYQSQRKKTIDNNTTTNTSTDNDPLFTYFDNVDDTTSYPEFEEGSAFDGGGADCYGIKKSFFKYFGVIIKKLFDSY
jgi:hypothetical protein